MPRPILPLLDAVAICVVAFGLYLPRPTDTVEKVLADRGAKRLRIVLMRTLGADKLAHTIDTGKVVCTRQPDGGGLVILAQGKSGQLARIQLTQVGQIVVQKVGLRYDDATGFVADPREVTGAFDLLVARLGARVVRTEAPASAGA